MKDVCESGHLVIMTGTTEPTETKPSDAKKLLNALNKGIDVTLCDDIIVAIASTLLLAVGGLW